MRQLSVVAAPSDGGMFLSWIGMPGNVEFAVKWRSTSNGTWNERFVGRKEHVFVPALALNTPHDFIVWATVGSNVLYADTLVATPRDRPSCAFPDYLPFQSFFCSREAADAWMRTRGISVANLRCRNQPVTDWGPDAGDCVYTAGEGFRMLLLRSADKVFNPSPHPPAIAETRNALRYAIWRDGHPFNSSSSLQPSALPVAQVGLVTNFKLAQSFLLPGTGRFKSRITRFTPATHVPGRYAIFHEGHGKSGTEIGVDMIEFLLTRGWEVYAMDMPMYGQNKVDQIVNVDTTHFDLWKFEDARTSILAVFVLPVKQMVDFIEATRPPATTLLMMGRSGGGFTSYLYAALDPRITASVSVAGGRPISQRLDAPWGPLELGDTEQFAPEVFAGMRHEDIMVAGGSRAGLLMFNTWDPCCYRVTAGDPFLAYLESGGARSGRIVRGFVDANNLTHGIGPAGYAELSRFLEDVTR